MPSCVRCQTDTDLYENGNPICITCGSDPKRKAPRVEVFREPQLRDTLVRDLVTATTRVNAYQKAFDQLMGYFPTDTSIREASENLDAARKELNRAHNCLNNFLSRGIIPEDLKRAVGR